MEVAHASRIRLVEIAMRKFAMEDAFCALGEAPFVIGNPAAIQVGGGVNQT